VAEANADSVAGGLGRVLQAHCFGHLASGLGSRRTTRSAGRGFPNRQHRAK
jgi:hypothetical protein